MVTKISKNSKPQLEGGGLKTAEPKLAQPPKCGSDRHRLQPNWETLKKDQTMSTFVISEKVG